MTVNRGERALALLATKGVSEKEAILLYAVAPAEQDENRNRVFAKEVVEKFRLPAAEFYADLHFPGWDTSYQAPMRVRGKAPSRIERIATPDNRSDEEWLRLTLDGETVRLAVSDTGVYIWFDGYSKEPVALLDLWYVRQDDRTPDEQEGDMLADGSYLEPEE